MTECCLPASLTFLIDVVLVLNLTEENVYIVSRTAFCSEKSLSYSYKGEKFQ